jgi:hypothetical protein
MEMEKHYLRAKRRRRIAMLTMAVGLFGATVGWFGALIVVGVGRHLLPPAVTYILEYLPDAVLAASILSVIAGGIALVLVDKYTTIRARR